MTARQRVDDVMTSTLNRMKNEKLSKLKEARAALAESEKKIVSATAERDRLQTVVTKLDEDMTEIQSRIGGRG